MRSLHDQWATLSDGDREPHETVKINQSTNIVIENSVISGADDNVIDFVAVQGGRVVGSQIHDTEGAGDGGYRRQGHLFR